MFSYLQQTQGNYLNSTHGQVIYAVRVRRKLYTDLFCKMVIHVFVKIIHVEILWWDNCLCLDIVGTFLEDDLYDWLIVDFMSGRAASTR